MPKKVVCGNAIPSRREKKTKHVKLNLKQTHTRNYYNDVCHIYYDVSNGLNCDNNNPYNKRNSSFKLMFLFCRLDVKNIFLNRVVRL